LAVKNPFVCLSAYQRIYDMVMQPGVEKFRRFNRKLTRYNFFANHPGSTLKDLSVSFGRDKGQLARLVNGLKSRGLLDAQVDVEDRRQVRLSLSKQGARAQAQLRIKTSQLANQAVQGLSVHEMLSLLELMQRIKSNLNAK